ncbi:MAG TPA: ABC transporter permease [Vicinamibacterales bacterium]|nr:ABC transporter permease [Vicinamibacterales bacterium]
MSASIASIRQGVRALRKRDSLLVIAIVVLALAAGVGTAIVDTLSRIAYAVPAGVREPDALVLLPRVGDYPGFQEAKQQLRSVSLGAYASARTDVAYDNIVAAVRLECVSPNFFEIVGAPIAFGNSLGAGQADSVVLAHRFWEGQLAGDRSSIGNAIAIGNKRLRIVGIASPEFSGLSHQPADLWVSLDQSSDLCTSGRNLLRSRNAAWLTTVGRLADGRSLSQLTTEISTLGLREQSVNVDLGDLPNVEGFVPAFRNAQQQEQQLLSWLELGSLVIIFLACSNMAALLGLRALARRRDTTIRVQLGASRRDIALQLFTESLALAVVSALAAFVVARWTYGALSTFSLSSALSASAVNLRSIGLLGFTVAVIGIASGAGPALTESRVSVAPHLRGDLPSDRRTGRIQQVVIVVQVAVAFALLIGSQLFEKSVAGVMRAPGYDLSSVLGVDVDPSRAHFTLDEDLQPIREDILERLKTQPVVQAVALASYTPLDADAPRQFVMVRGASGSPAQLASVNFISPEYFETVGTQIVKGRSLTATDGASGASVVVLDAGIANKLWPGQDALGRCAALMGDLGCVEVVGISEPRRPQRIAATTQEAFLPVAQFRRYGLQYPGRTLVVRPRVDSVTALGQLGATLRLGWPQVRVEVHAVTELARVQTRLWRLGASALGSFGYLTLVLTVLGIYSSLATANAHRRSELGLRLAIGASPSSIFRLVVRRAFLLVISGWVGGTLTAALVVRLVQHAVAGSVLIDPKTYVGTTALLVLVGCLGSFVPALRAARLNPARALTSL